MGALCALNLPTESCCERPGRFARAELLLLSPSILVPCLNHNGTKVWDTLAIGDYLNEVAPNAGLLPSNPVHRAHSRSICGEMHSGFNALRGALPMNIKARMKGFKVWSKAQSDIDRILGLPEMQQRISAAMEETEDIEELQVDF